MNALNEAIKIAGSQTELARLAGISQAAISKLASGKSMVSAKTAIKIENAVNGKVSRQSLCPDVFGQIA